MASAEVFHNCPTYKLCFSFNQNPQAIIGWSYYAYVVQLCLCKYFKMTVFVNIFVHIIQHNILLNVYVCVLVSFSYAAHYSFSQNTGGTDILPAILSHNFCDVLLVILANRIHDNWNRTTKGKKKKY